MLHFRRVHPNEDDVCGLLLANAYLTVWNHNWFQSLKEPLRPARFDGKNVQTLNDLPKLNHARAIFYRFLIRLTREIGGGAIAAVKSEPGGATSTGDGLLETIVAVILYHPPHIEYDLSLANLRGIPRSLKQLHDAGVLEVLRCYGIDSFRRVNVVFQRSVNEAMQKGLARQGLQRRGCGFIQMLAVHHLHQGKGYGRELLQNVLETHFRQYKSSPMVLDTTTKQAARSYRKLLFKEIEVFRFPGNYDKDGFPMKKRLTNAEYNQAIRERNSFCYGRIMIRLPPETD